MWLDLSKLEPEDRCRLARKFRENIASPAPLTCDQKLLEQDEARQLARWQRWGDLLTLGVVGWLLWVLLA